MHVLGQSDPAGSSIDTVDEADAGAAGAYCVASFLNKVAGPMTPKSPLKQKGKNTSPDAPAHPSGRDEERRAYARVRLSLPLRVQRVAGQRDIGARALRTLDISSSGAYFLSPHGFDPGTPIELELLIVDQPPGPRSVRMRAEAHVVRAAKTAPSGWHGVAVAFDDIRFLRDDPPPPRLHAG